MLKQCTVYNAFVMIERERKLKATNIQKQAPNHCHVPMIMASCT